MKINNNSVISESDADSRYLRIDGSNYLTTSDSFTFLRSSEGTGFELGATTGASYLDFHSDSSSWDDFNARIISWGGGSGTYGSLDIIANTVDISASNTTFDADITVKGKTSLDNGTITTDGTGNLTTTGLLNAKTPSDVPGTSTGTNVATTYWVDQHYSPKGQPFTRVDPVNMTVGSFVEITSANSSQTLTFPDPRTSTGAMIAVWNNSGATPSVTSAYGKVSYSAGDMTTVPTYKKFIFISDGYNWISFAEN
ncbi:hypothetical protein ATPR_2867 [Acetobacter tropicalis NBRC 101654]|uniref:Uncharacterized protein n=1 Tax=Acetobacter tropicalis NBRC 101654 TaxID=749388 RepID=F7VHL8_9PROT|nr:hypothetical protein ATPR_2867 [Acetobacter tropicalis NBRC 101654]